MKYLLWSRRIEVARLLVLGFVLSVGAATQAQISVAGFAIGQEVQSCPNSSVPMHKDSRERIACRFPAQTVSALGVLADQFAIASDESGRIEAVLASGFDAVHAASNATSEYGPPDGVGTRGKVSSWAWQRGNARLEIFSHSDEFSSSWLFLQRYPKSPARSDGK